MSHIPSRRRSSGFTLIELLVVVAIIAILMALLLPAVQKVREAANRMRCGNNLKQWGIAMHLHHHDHKKFPYAAKNNPRTQWVVQVWPYIEQNDAFSNYNFNIHFHQAPNTVQNTLNGVMSTPVALYYCPSDRTGAIWRGDSFWRPRGNYVVNWGNVTQPFTPPAPTARAPFGYKDFQSRNQPWQSQISDFKDGTSLTMLMSEVKMFRIDTSPDVRGDMMNDDNGCTYYQTINTPNSGVDAVLSGWCVNTPELPCVSAARVHKAARSYHHGGVNVLFGDGSVRHVHNSIALNTWRAIGTMNGEEPVGDF